MRIIKWLFLCFLLVSSFCIAEDANQRAKKAAKSCLQLVPNAKKRAREFLKIAFFIETELKHYIAQEKYYLNTDETKLLYPIEYDPKTHLTFIHLGSLLGSGADKFVTKSILYDAKTPKLVAKLIQKESEQAGREIDILKKLKGFPGVVQLIAVTKNRTSGTDYVSLFCDYYFPGSLAKVMNDKSYSFSLKEKMLIAFDILKGLDAVESLQLTHRDLKKENYLIDIAKGKKGKRYIHVVIADFGNATPIGEASGIKSQLTSLYSAPEGILFYQLKGAAYYKTDLFAAGCVLFRLFYERKPLWQKELERKKLNDVSAQMLLLKYLLQDAGKRRQALEKKVGSGLKLSTKEEFERLILGMLHEDPAKRNSAKNCRKKLELLLSH